MRTKFIEPDYRNESSAELICTRCGKEIKGAHKFIFCELDHYYLAIHPEDISQCKRRVDKVPVGNDCARKIGIEYTVS